jgi:hypothetical protein
MKNNILIQLEILVKNNIKGNKGMSVSEVYNSVANDLGYKTWEDLIKNIDKLQDNIRQNITESKIMNWATIVSKYSSVRNVSIHSDLKGGFNQPSNECYGSELNPDQLVVSIMINIKEYCFFAIMLSEVGCVALISDIEADLEPVGIMTLDSFWVWLDITQYEDVFIDPINYIGKGDSGYPNMFDVPPVSLN